MTNNTSGISRRGFLTGATAAGAFAALGLAGCAPKAQGDAMAETKGSGGASEGASANDWLGSAPEISDDQITATRDCEVLIVGAGMSGIMAAATAADLGVDFIVAEKGSEPAASHFDVGAVNSRFTSELTGQTIDKGRILNELNRYASFKNDASVARTWIEESGPTVEWLQAFYEDKLGACQVTVDVENGGEGDAGGTIYYIPPECHAFLDGEGERIVHVEAMTEILSGMGQIGRAHV